MPAHPVPLLHDGAAFVAERHGAVAVIRLKRHVFAHAADLHDKGELLAFLGDLETNDDIRVVVLLAHPQKRGMGEFVEWHRMVTGPDCPPNALPRFLNGFQQLVAAILASTKPYIYGDQGRVTLPYVSLGLVSDLRVLADDAVIENPSASIDMLCAGGSLYFLTRTVGRGRTFELAALHETIDPETARRLGLVERVVPAAAVEEEARSIAQRLAARSPVFLGSLKRAVNHGAGDFAAYLEFEAREILKHAHWRK